MCPWVAFTGLILLWTDAVVSQVQVSGVVGQPVMLPCTYSTAREVTTMCWGRGPCPWSLCSNQLIGTDGHHVTFQRNARYELNGLISKGNVSLTIKNVTQADSGTYCCRVELPGWFNDLKVNILLEVEPAPPKVTSVPTSARVSTSAPTMPASTQNLKTVPPKVTSVPTSHQVSTSAPTMPASTQNLKTDTTSSSPMRTAETKTVTPQETITTSLPLNPCLADGNGSVAQPSDGVWEYNETHMCLDQKPSVITNEARYIGISVTAVLLLTILTAIIIKKYLCTRRKVLQIRKVSLNDPKNGTLENPAAVYYRADENVYIENNLNNVHSDPMAR